LTEQTLIFALIGALIGLVGTLGTVGAVVARTFRAQADTIGKLSEHVDKAIVERKIAETDRIKQIEENAVLKNDMASVHLEIAAARREIAEQQIVALNQERRIVELEAEKEKQATEIELRTKERDDARSQNGELKARVLELEAQVRTLQGRVAELERRKTGPLPGAMVTSESNVAAALTAPDAAIRQPEAGESKDAAAEGLEGKF